MIPTLRRHFVFAALVAIVPALFAQFFLVRVRPGEIGVRQAKLGGGVELTDHGPGVYLDVPGLHAWRRLDAATSYLCFDGRETAPALDIRTADNNAAQVCAIVPYRLRQGEAHLLVKEGLDGVYRKRVRTTVDNVLRSNLSTLASEDWFDVDLRTERSGAILPELNAALAPLRVEAEAVLLTDISFSKDYEKKLQQAQITVQEGLLYDAQRALEEAEGRAGGLLKETEALEKSRRAEWERELEERKAEQLAAKTGIDTRAWLYDSQVRAQADREYEELVAEGKAAVSAAIADTEERRMRALDTPAGRVWLAREAAENLDIGRVTLNSNDPRVPSVLRVDELVGILTGLTSGEPR